MNLNQILFMVFLKYKMLSNSNDFSLLTIISSTSTYSYNPVEFLIEIIDPKEDCTKDSFSFW